MARKSSIYYIAPSAISITPNANNSPNDLAVYIAQGAKIKVYYQRIFYLGLVDATYQEWTLTGRNRSLAEPTRPYTIYARLRKVTSFEPEDIAAAHADAYLVFAGQRNDGTEEEPDWQDPYELSENTSATDGMNGVGSDGKIYSWAAIPEKQTQDNRSDYWWVKIGTVSEVKNGARTVNLDTGILGTDQYNEEWELNPDTLPLRIELSCKVDGKELGTTPYVYWGETLNLAAKLVEGWEANANASVKQWTITRNSGSPVADDRWSYPYEDDQTARRRMPDGMIDLSHEHNADDFAGAFASMFTVVAWGHLSAAVSESSDSGSSDSSSSDSSSDLFSVSGGSTAASSDSSTSTDSDSSDPSTTLEPLAAAVITIFAETQERYELILSTGVMAYDPLTGRYDPQEGIGVRIRATNQRGDADYLTRQSFDRARLSVQYATVGTDLYTSVEPSGTGDTFVTIPTAAFAPKKSVNVRLVRFVTAAVPESSDSGSSSDSDSSEQEPTRTIELAVATIAYVRNGEDSTIREYIYKRSTELIDFDTDGEHNANLPANIQMGEVAPAGIADGTDTNKDQADWVPNTWTDDWQGADPINKYEYESYRDWIPASAVVPDSSDSGSSDSSDSDSSDDILSASGGSAAAVQEASASGHWGPFSKPRIYDHYTTDGGTPENRYQWNSDPDKPPYPWNTADSSDSDSSDDGSYDGTLPNEWTNYATNRPAGTNYLWMTTAIRKADGNYGPWGYPVRLTGDKGDAGEDATDREWIYIGKPAYHNPYADGTPEYDHPKDILHGKVSGQGDWIDKDDQYGIDDYVPEGWSDTAIATDNTNNHYVYASWRVKPKGSDTWSAFHDPILWSNWGVQGMDGDGVQYIYKLFVHELTEKERTDEIPTNAVQNENGEWMPQADDNPNNEGVNDGWSDDPLSPTPDKPFCYCSVIKKLNGRWQTTSDSSTSDSSTSDSSDSDSSSDTREYGLFGPLALWSVYAESGLLLDLDNQMDAFGTDVNGVVLNDQTITTHAEMFFGAAHKDIHSVTVEVRDADNNVIATARVDDDSDSSDDISTAFSASGGSADATPLVTVAATIATDGKATVAVTVHADDTSDSSGDPASTITTDLYADITATCDEGTRAARFSLKHVSSSAPGVSPTICQLFPSMSNIPFARNNDGTFTPSSYIITCGYKETTGATTTSHPNDVSTLTHNIYYRKATGANYTKLVNNKGSLPFDPNDDTDQRRVVVEPTDPFVEFILCTNTTSSLAPSAVTGLIDVETVPVVKDGAKGDDGKGIASIERTYAISASGSSPNDSMPPSDLRPYNASDWSSSSPATTDDKQYLWAREHITYTKSGSSTRYYCIGRKGDNGIDAQDVEWVFIRTKTNIPPVIDGDGGESPYTDHNSKNYTYDDHLPKVTAGTGGSLTDIEKDNSDPRNSNPDKPYECTDDPKGVDSTWRYEWEIKRTKGAAVKGHREWNPYSGEMSLRNNYAESALVIDVDNDNDQFGTDINGVILPDGQKRSTVVSMYFGSHVQELNTDDNVSAPGVKATLKYEDGSSVGADVASVTCGRDSLDHTKGNVEVTIGNPSTSGTHVSFPSNHSSLKVHITANCAMGTKSIDFTVQQVKSGAPGVSPTIYQLALSQKSLSYGYNAYDQLVAKSNRVTVNVKVTDENGSTIQTLSQSGKTCTWGFDGTYNTDTVNPYNPIIEVGANDVGSHTKVSILLSTGDREEIPILKDGKDGTNGQNGQDGQDGVSPIGYGLVPSTTAVNFHSNAVGDFSPSYCDVTCGWTKTEGDETTSGSWADIIPNSGGRQMLYRIIRSDGTPIQRYTSVDWVTQTLGWDYYNHTQDSAPSGNVPWNITPGYIRVPVETSCLAVEFGISLKVPSVPTAGGDTRTMITSEADILCRVTVPFIFDGRRGATGDKGDQGNTGAAGEPGKMFYSMGEWVAQAYSRTSLLIPMVHYNDGEYSQATGEGNYYYLDADSASASDEPGPNSSVWTKAVGFGVVITQGLFAEFAKLGKFIFSGDFMFSMNGRIGSTEYNNAQLLDDKPAYTRFIGAPGTKYTIQDYSGEVLKKSQASVDTFPMRKGVKVKVTMQAKYIQQSGYATTFNVALYLKYGGTWNQVNTAIATVDTTTLTEKTIEVVDASHDVTEARLQIHNNDTSKPVKAYLSDIEYTYTEGYFEPNWWVDQLTGKMSAARGNFVVNPDGTTIMQNAVIKGSLMYNKLCAMDMSQFTSNNNVVSAWESSKGLLAFDNLLLYGTYNSGKSVTIQLPPASSCVGASFKLQNRTSDWDDSQQMPTTVSFAVQQDIDDGPQYITIGGPAGTYYWINRFVLPFAIDGSFGGVVTFSVRNDAGIREITLLATACPKRMQNQEDTYSWVVIEAD